MDKVKKLKIKFSNEELCKNLPKEICEYMNYVKKMNFGVNPDYRYLQSLFLNILRKIGEKNDLIFSWVDKKTIPRKIICRSNSRSLQKIYKNILSANSSKVVPTSNSELAISNLLLDKQFLSQNCIKGSDMSLNKDKSNNYYYSDNNLNIIYNNTYNNEKNINPKQKIIHIILEEDNKKNNLCRTLNNDNNIKKSITHMDNLKLKIIKFDKKRKNLNSKNIIPIKDNDKKRDSDDINFHLNKNIIFNKKNFNKISIRKQINNIPNKKNLTLNLDQNNNNNFDIKNSKNKIYNNTIGNSININNININKVSDLNYTYVTIYKNLNFPKLNILSNNLINQTSIDVNKKYQKKYLNTKRNFRNYKSPYNFHKTNLYNSIFACKSDFGRGISNFTGKLIKKKQTNSQQKFLINKIEKFKINLIEKNGKTRPNKPRNLRDKLLLYSKKNLYISPIYNKTGIKISKSPEQKIYQE